VSTPYASVVRPRASQPVYYAAARHPKAMWEVPGSRHTGGLEAVQWSTHGGWWASSTALLANP
jgi:hypothetical protein